MSRASMPLMLPEGLVITPVAELPPDLRSRFRYEEDAYALSRPRSRVPTQIVDPGTARLLEEFRTPVTVVQAVLNYSRAADQDAEEVLTRVHPILVQLAADQLLVPAGSGLSRPIEPSLAPGESFGAYEVLESISVLDDTELYRARTPDGTEVALKVARRTHAAALAAAFDHEAAILERLDGTAAPRLAARGEHDGRPFLALEWIPSAPAPEAVPEFGDPRDPSPRRERLALCIGVLDRYVDLHRAGVLHGDVHPGNILVTGDGEVRLVDFALARAGGSAGSGPAVRGGVLFFLEPEVASVWGKGTLPPSTEAGEQYALGAVLYLLLTSATYLDFRLDRSEIRRQIVETPPRPFREAGVPPWPEVEAVLDRALAKRPEERHPSVAAFRDRLREILERLSPASATAPAGTPSPAARALLESYLDRLHPGGDLAAGGFEPPRASVMFGAAGLAYALYRMACAGEDAGLLALGDHWATRALADVGNPEASYNPELELTPELLGPNALFHTASGIHATAALVALAQGNPGQYAVHSARFLQAAEVATPNLDLTMGRGGALLGSLLLREAHPAAGLEASAGRWARALWAQLEAAPPIEEAPLPLNLGMAHGWAGVLYALLRWHRATGEELPPGVPSRLRELADCAEPAGRGLCWPWRDPGRRVAAGSMPGWCNGSAGFVFLWTLAAEVFEESEWTGIAERAAWDAWQRGRVPGSLCCGSVGVAYALLNLARHTGDPAWIDRAARIADRAAGSGVPGRPRDSLYKGDLGLALLIAELDSPDEARMPFFEHEGWPGR